MRIVLVGVVFAGLLGGGCSWTLVQRAPTDYDPKAAAGPPECTASLGPPISDIWDAIAIGGGLVATGTVTTAVRSLGVDPVLGVTQIATGVGLGAMFGLSSRYGFQATERCRRLQNAFQRELHRRLEERE